MANGTCRRTVTIHLPWAVSEGTLASLFGTDWRFSHLTGRSARPRISALQHRTGSRTDAPSALIGMPIARHASRPALTLLESGRRPPLSHQLAYGGSVAGQVALVCAVMVGVSRVVVPIEAPLSERPTFLAPLRQEHPRPVQEKLTYVAFGGVAAPIDQPRVGETKTLTKAPELALAERVGGGDSKPPEEAQDDKQSQAFSEIEVDSAASRDPDSEGPVYPPKLMAKGITGSVLATFVVGVDGRPELSTYIALESTNIAFSDAVRDALPRMKFRAAKRSNVIVRQQVELRFTFRVEKAPVPTPTRPTTPVG